MHMGSHGAARRDRLDVGSRGVRGEIADSMCVLVDDGHPVPTCTCVQSCDRRCEQGTSRGCSQACECWAR